MSTSIRTFIAVDLSEENQKALARIQDKLKECPTPVRWVQSPNLHLTLKFLGGIHESKVQKIIGLIDEISHNTPGFAFDITHLGAFPKIRKPNIIWAGVERNADKLAALAEKLDHGLVSFGFAKEPKKFAAHITLGRVKTFKGAEELGEHLSDIKISPPLVQDKITVTFYQSTLSPAGPIYEPLYRSDLISSF